MFELALDWRPGSRLRTAASQLQAAPVIHLSMHGNSDGIGLTNKDLFTWKALHRLLRPINEEVPGGVLVSFSTCEGVASSRMSMRLDGAKPLYATLGSEGNVDWDNALVAFTAFYHNWFKGIDPLTATKRMRAAAGQDDFHFVFGQQAQATYQNIIVRDWVQAMASSPQPSQANPNGQTGLGGLLGPDLGRHIDPPDPGTA